MRTNTAAKSRKNLTKVVASVALVAGAASVAGLGTFGAFTSTTHASQDVSSGRVLINMSAQAERGLNLAADKLVAGDKVQRAVVLTRDSVSETFGSVKLTTTTENPSILTTATDGLRLSVDQCSVAWTVNAKNELVCANGTETVLLAPQAVIGANLDLVKATEALNSTDAKANLRVQLELPTAAGNEFQDKTSTVKFTFDATQRAATTK